MYLAHRPYYKRSRYYPYCVIGVLKMRSVYISYGLNINPNVYE